jgi:hypothetical protein
VYPSLKFELCSYSCSKVPCLGLIFHFSALWSNPAFSQNLAPWPTRLSNINFLARAVQKKFDWQRVSVAPFGPTRHILETSCQGLLALKYELRSYSRLKAFCQGLILARFGPTRRLLKSSSSSLPGPQISTSQLEPFKSSYARSPRGTFRSDPPFLQKLVPRPSRPQIGTS